MNLRRSAQIGLLTLAPLLGACDKDTETSDGRVESAPVTEEGLSPADFDSLRLMLNQHQGAIERELDGACEGPISFQTLHISNSDVSAEMSFAGSSRGDLVSNDGNSVAGTSWICSKNSSVTARSGSLAVEDGRSKMVDVTRHVPHKESSCSGMLKIDMKGKAPRYFSVDAECGADAAGAEYVQEHTWGSRQLEVSPTAFLDQSWRDELEGQ